MFRYLLPVLLVGAYLPLRAQHWTAASLDEPRATRVITPKEARGVRTDAEALRTLLWAAPHERDVRAEQSPAQLSLPHPAGGTAEFRIVRYSLVRDGRYPEQRTWYGVSTTDPAQTVFLDWTPRGFHAAVRGGRQPGWWVDPAYRDDPNTYQSYFRRAIGEPKSPFDCTTPAPAASTAGGAAADCALREYTIAVTATPEFSNYHGAFSPQQAHLVQGAVVTTLNRLNQIYTRDVGVRLQLLPGNDTLYFFDAATSPFTDNRIATLVNENISVQEQRVALDSFDLGHVFTQGANGGRAFGNSTCLDALKSGGATSLAAPEGDPFAVDYVAHEIGHQFGGRHTQNNSCNYDPASGMEPGSGSTIMGYAGICLPNVQTNSDGYFHGRSVEEITGFVTNPFRGGGCATVVDQSLARPTLGTVPDRMIPAGTPFVLTAPGGEADDLTYQWEQYDPEAGELMPPSAFNRAGPLFRSRTPTAAAARHFPQYETTRTGSRAPWEVTPGVNREANFRLTAHRVGGSYGCSNARMTTLSFVADAGAFAVTDPADANRWTGGQTAQVQWDVAGTDAPAFASPLVRVLLSTDAGRSFTLLADSVANAGHATVNVPDVASDSCRIQVRSLGSYFYQISPQNFTVGPAVGADSLTLRALTTTTVADCFAERPSAGFDFVTRHYGGPGDTLVVTVDGLPAAATVALTPARPRPGGRFTVTVGNLRGLPAATYAGRVTVGYGTVTVSADVTIEKLADAPPAGPALLTPGGRMPDVRPTLTVADVGQPVYDIQVALSPDFAELAYDYSGSAPRFQLPDYLAANTVYYWRARYRDPTASCATSRWSLGDFLTGDCEFYAYAGPGATLSTGPPVQTATLDLTVPSGGTLVDVDLTDLDLEHSYLNDLEVSVLDPNGREATVFRRSCGGLDDIRVSFDDEAAVEQLPCPPVAPGSFVRPGVDPLATFDGPVAAGDWRLRVRDLANQDGGRLHGFGLKVCWEVTALPLVWQAFDVRSRKDRIRVAWRLDVAGDPPGLRLERAPASAPEEFSVLTTPPLLPDDAFTDRTARPGVTYLYRLRGTEADGTVSYGPVRSGRLADGARLRLAPNPARNVLTVSATPHPAGTYELLNIHGQRVGAGQFSGPTGQLSLGGLPPGVYLLRAAGYPTERFVKR